MKLARSHRRILASILIVLGAVLMFAAPETIGKRETLNGWVLIAVGIAIETIGLALERRS